jgi:drug/metabolite transporter (DMT)-like permease
MTLKSREERTAKLLIFLVPALWAVNYVVARKAPGVIDPHTLALGRWTIAGLVLAGFSRTELWAQRFAIRQVWPQYIVLGTLGMVICGAWVYIAGRSTSAVNIALIYSASPVLIMIASGIWLHERMNKLQIAGVCFAVAGVFHVVVKGQWAAMGQIQFAAGDLWIVAATISWALYAVLMKKWPSALSATARLAVTCAGGVLVLMPFALMEQVSPQALPWTLPAVVLVVAAALFPGVGAYLAYSYAQKILGASRVAVSLYLGPLYGALAAWWLLDEHLQGFHLVGSLFIFPGILLATQHGRRA